MQITNAKTVETSTFCTFDPYSGCLEPLFWFSGRCSSFQSVGLVDDLPVAFISKSRTHRMSGRTKPVFEEDEPISCHWKIISTILRTSYMQESSSHVFAFVFRESKSYLPLCFRRMQGMERKVWFRNHVWMTCKHIRCQTKQRRSFVASFDPCSSNQKTCCWSFLMHLFPFPVFHVEVGCIKTSNAIRRASAKKDRARSSFARE